MLRSLSAPGVTVRPGLRILVAEDNEINQMVITHMLAGHGLCADVVSDGEEAVRRVRGGAAYDLVLMDIHMPVMDGLSAARAIRGLAGAAAATPIIALTADVSRDLFGQCFGVGMNGVVEKPINIAALLAAMARVTGLVACAPRR